MKVIFCVNGSSERIEKVFTSEYECRKFVNKLKHSKRLTLISYPLFK